MLPSALAQNTKGETLYSRAFQALLLEVILDNIYKTLRRVLGQQVSRLYSLRAFISAGTPSVLVSLWYVPDSSTAVLMTEFYRQLQVTSDKARSLRTAMLETIKQHPRPLDWAAFTLMGEAE